MKKFLAIVLALATVLGLCACGGNSNGGHGLTEDGRVKLSIGLPTSATVLDHKNNAFTKWIEEKCGVELTFIEYAGGTDVATQISTTIAARQELPDILWGIGLGETTRSRYGREGYFQDLTPFYEDKEGASKVFWDRIATDLTEEEQEYLLSNMYDPNDGKIYGCPTVETSAFDKQQFQIWINRTWLDKLNLKAPTNNEELVTVLKAFKEQDPNGNGQPDEIPLFGTQNGVLGAYVVDWLMNLFVYYNSSHVYNIDENDKLYPVYMTDEYREGLKFINYLYKEQLLSSLAWTASKAECRTINTPATGTAIVGIFCGHLSPTVTQGSEVLYEYEPLPTWGYAVRNDMSAKLSTFITESCTDVEKAFEVCMAACSWEGSMRARYGEYGVNWTDPTPGATSIIGLPAKYQILEDVGGGVQNTVRWSKMGPVINIMAEGEEAEVSDALAGWTKFKMEMHAKQYALLKEVEETRNPKKTIVKLNYTEEEEKQREQASTNVGNRRKKAMAEFCTGIMDPNNDADWAAYKQELEGYGLADVVALAQKVYDRQK